MSVLRAATRLIGRAAQLADGIGAFPRTEREGQILDAACAATIASKALAGIPELETLDVRRARAVADLGMELTDSNLSSAVEISTLQLSGAEGVLAAEISRPKVRASGGALLWFHGGGFVIGGLKSHRRFIAKLCERSGVSVVAVDYRLGPEHPFPAAHDDAVAAYLNLRELAAELGIDGANLAVGGDSAGGNLAAHVARSLAGTADVPSFQALLYPILDFTGACASRGTYAHGFLLTRSLMDWFTEHYLPAEQSRRDVRLSPIFCETFSEIPPAIVVSAGFDPLRDDARNYAELLAKSGRVVDYWCETALIHGYATFGGASAEANRAIGRLAQRISAFAAQNPSATAGRVSSSKPRVCIIGAGSSGISAAKTLWDRGFDFVCYEASDRVGGNWAFKNPNGMSAAYRSLHINTSREQMEFADFPMPEEYPDYPHHALIQQYFENYVEHFGFRDRLRFSSAVQRVERRDGAWMVTDSLGETERYDACIVANGHHWNPKMPEPIAGEFSGATIHSHDYVDPQEPLALRDKAVMVVGFGNSAVDIACELSRRGNASRVFLSTRRGAWVIPHYLFGIPTDHLGAKISKFLPPSLARAGFAAVQRAVVGRPTNFGLPQPDHKILHAHPTISSDLLPAIGRGDITPKPAIARYDGNVVEFVDGSREQVEAIVYCTGYRVSFPFFDSAFLSAPENRIGLYKKVVHPEHENLFFLGLLQPLGAIMPLAEAQAKWIAEILAGASKLPTRADMVADIARDEQEMRERYVASTRHTLQVDFLPYLKDIGRERAAGRARAASAGEPQ